MQSEFTKEHVRKYETNGLLVAGGTAWLIAVCKSCMRRRSLAACVELTRGRLSGDD